jgi:hypothetical protein
LVRNDVMFGTGQLPKFEDDQFWAIKGELLAAPDERLKTERLGLIPTAEVSLTNLVRESIVDEKELPMRLTALTPCFPRRSGRGGPRYPRHDPAASIHKGRAGLDRNAETSRDEHERMLSCAEEVLKRLDLHYRVMTLCSGDMGFSAQKTYDIEVWMPGQGEGGAYPRNFELLGVRRLPGAAHGCALARARRQAAFRAHAERLRHGGRPRADRGHGNLSAGRTARSRCPTCCSPIWAGSRPSSGTNSAKQNGIASRHLLDREAMGCYRPRDAIDRPAAGGGLRYRSFRLWDDDLIESLRTKAWLKAEEFGQGAGELRGRDIAAVGARARQSR